MSIGWSMVESRYGLFPTGPDGYMLGFPASFRTSPDYSRNLPKCQARTSNIAESESDHQVPHSSRLSAHVSVPHRQRPGNSFLEDPLCTSDSALVFFAGIGLSTSSSAAMRPYGPALGCIVIAASSGRRPLAELGYRFAQGLGIHSDFHSRAPAALASPSTAGRGLYNLSA